MEHFHERLKHLLQERGITSTELIVKTRKSQGTINNYRNGHSFPDLPFFKILKDLMPNHNGDWLLYGEGQPFLNNDIIEKNSNTSEEKKAQMEVQHNSLIKTKIAHIESALEEVKQLAMVGLEKLKGVASVRLSNYLNQFVNTQNLHLCK